jgi:hypothetical protein
VRVSAGGGTAEAPLEVLEDPRLEVEPAVRAAWAATLLDLFELTRRAAQVAERAEARVERLEGEDRDRPGLAAARNLARETDELRSRLQRLRSAVEGWVGPLTADQESQRAFLSQMLETLAGEMREAEGAAGG